MPLIVKWVSALEKVFVDEQPRDYPAHIPLSGLKGETQSFQIALSLQPPAEWEHQLYLLQADCALPLRVRLVDQVPVRFPCFSDTDAHYLRKAPGLYPDPLRDMAQGQPFRVYQGQWTGLWVDIEVPSDAQPGDYSLQLQFSDQAGQPAGELNVPFLVVDHALPPQTLIQARWLHADALATYYNVPVFSDRHFEILESFIALGARRGINMQLIPIHTPPLDTRVGHERPTAQLVEVFVEAGGYRFQFDLLRRYIAMCQRAGVEYFEMAHLFTQWGAYHAPKIMGWRDGELVQLFGWQTDATGPEYAGFLKAYLSALTQELRALGVAEKCWFHISDEPGRQHIDQYLAAKALVAPYLAGFPIMDALSDYAFYENGAVAHPIPALNHMDEFLKAKVPDLWTYYCVGQHKDVSNSFIAMPASRTRIIGMQLYQYELKGFLQWAYNFYYSQYSDYALNPWLITDADGFAPAGDAFQVYPGSNGQPVESLRFMLFFQGLQDLRVLQALEAKAGREATLKLLFEDLAQTPTLTDYPRQADWLLAMRWRVNQALAGA